MSGAGGIGEEGCCAGERGNIVQERKRLGCGGTGLPRQEEVAGRLGLPIDTLRRHLARLRARYRELLREEVARTIGVAEDVDEELRHLSPILIAAA